ncbi:hypothetical protein EV644_13512 [Kribbella orskensis]|uniref:Uncharacterized protein n=1 Tax=Kribbella orskensis TaxID=2512216 RepID=A0ABY2B7S5_9ACTN|nr:hypothetical protein EV642_13712 [Kribbella sp. VKM Ac-2500]TCO10213.1 hypothetical protein EV644_13512 [Kribbella orskensis]
MLLGRSKSLGGPALGLHLQVVERDLLVHEAEQPAVLREVVLRAGPGPTDQLVVAVMLGHGSSLRGEATHRIGEHLVQGSELRDETSLRRERRTRAHLSAVRAERLAEQRAPALVPRPDPDRMQQGRPDAAAPVSRYDGEIDDDQLLVLGLRPGQPGRADHLAVLDRCQAAEAVVRGRRLQQYECLIDRHQRRELPFRGDRRQYAESPPELIRLVDSHDLHEAQRRTSTAVGPSPARQWCGRRARLATGSAICSRNGCAG